MSNDSLMDDMEKLTAEQIKEMSENHYEILERLDAILNPAIQQVIKDPTLMKFKDNLLFAALVDWLAQMTCQYATLVKTPPALLNQLMQERYQQATEWYEQNIAPVMKARREKAAIASTAESFDFSDTTDFTDLLKTPTKAKA
jgi:dephospho-CoA kinase